MLTINKSVCVAPEVNLKNPLHKQVLKKASGRSTLALKPRTKNRGISGPTKRNNVIQKN